MHALATTKPPRPQQPNRRERRRKKQPRARAVAVPTRPTEARPQRLPDEHCRHRVPRHYAVKVNAVSRDTYANTPNRRAVVAGPLWVCYECFLHSLPSLMDAPRVRVVIDKGLIRPVSDDEFTTESMSAMAADWLSNHEDVDLDLNYRATERQDRDEAEVLLWESFQRYLDSRGWDDAQCAECEDRYRQVRREWGDRDEWGLWQWLGREFPGWLERERT